MTGETMRLKNVRLRKWPTTTVVATLCLVTPVAGQAVTGGLEGWAGQAVRPDLVASVHDFLGCWPPAC